MHQFKVFSDDIFLAVRLILWSKGTQSLNLFRVIYYYHISNHYQLNPSNHPPEFRFEHNLNFNVFHCLLHSGINTGFTVNHIHLQNLIITTQAHERLYLNRKNIDYKKIKSPFAIEHFRKHRRNYQCCYIQKMPFSNTTFTRLLCHCEKRKPLISRSI